MFGAGREPERLLRTRTKTGLRAPTRGWRSGAKDLSALFGRAPYLRFASYPKGPAARRDCVWQKADRSADERPGARSHSEAGVSTQNHSKLPRSTDCSKSLESAPRAAQEA